RLLTAWLAERGMHAVVPLREPNQLGVPLDGMAGRVEPIGQEALVVVLGKTENERERADAAADVPEPGDGELPGPVANVKAVEPKPGGHYPIGDAELAIELEGPVLDGHRAGRLPGTGVLVDEAQRCPGLRQPQGEDQPGRACSDDQDLWLA